jgi:predicted CXXCH cytochrome family protein
VSMRQSSAIIGLGLGVLVGVSACSDQTRYRVLCFFFDGVPEPGAKPSRGYPPLYGAPGQATATSPGDRQAPRPPSCTHTPYRENRCAFCHDAGSGLLTRTVQKGLCRECHPAVPGDAPYVHGPVAVSDCLACHEPHTAFYPKLLLKEDPRLCLDCHRRQDLTQGPHHAAIGEGPCVECHDPHAGNDPFFLKRSGR